jgi:alkylation response protein AidB-like acyl-CoA dehydrogenase
MRRAGVFEWRTLIQRLGERFASRAAEHDENDRFVHANWEELKQEKLFSAMVPEELGGAGLPHSEMCNLIREMAFSATKAFASGSPAGNLLLTSGRYQDPKEGWQVLHFPLSLRSEGVRVLENWKAMGMRGSGSNTVVLEKVFVGADSIGIRRPMGKYHRIWDIVLTVALPLVGGAYLGVAEASGRIARESAIRRGDDGVTCELLGELENELTTARLAFDSMVAVTNNFEFQPSPQKTSEVLVRKTILTQAVIRTASKALEVTGGGGYFRSQGLERLLRDAYAGQFHPLPPRKQHRFTGRLAMGLGVNEDSESGS